ncbi:N-acetyltransferase [Periweissella fabaria]|uniref:Protein RibT n=1 Tax=Periweissella fabaria TaxID=546157 RepID=A0ABN8BEB7_9LACO|nr:N-acetyltransferase [Periweissella fabaria]MCM0597415.1 N-acetyltransferase [Periweissella fabaria]CAH0416080.1 Protein RibT [Periweissella fabaria]
MLVKYRLDYKKIALGLLSYIPGLRNLQHLEAEFAWYAASPNRELLLWRDSDGHFTAIVGVEHVYGVLLLRHISITPALRDSDLMFNVLDALQTYNSDKILMGTIAGQKIINAWRRHNEQRTPN